VIWLRAVNLVLLFVGFLFLSYGVYLAGKAQAMNAFSGATIGNGAVLAVAAGSVLFGGYKNACALCTCLGERERRGGRGKQGKRRRRKKERKKRVGARKGCRGGGRVLTRGLCV
jgi:hypothetical protein